MPSRKTPQSKEYYRNRYLRKRAGVLARQKEDRLANPEKYRLRKKKYYEAHKASHSERGRAQRLRVKYGITIAQYEEMLRMGNGCCWICEKPPKTIRLHVDHSHQAPDKGRVRGLACFRCNKLLIGRHTAETAKKILTYLESPFDGRNL